ncbi:MAG: inositol 2-dehydrogenase [Rhodobacteraceae bacterium]|nr:inositol 2-dehydrogenase [Paracoccaceae bacterium]
MMIRFGVLGSGRIGQVHARTLAHLPGAKVAAVSDAFESAAQSLAGEVGSDVRDTDAIVASDDIDAIAICTPTDTHADLIEASVRAGKPVFCEKPIDLDTDRVRSCLATVAESGVPLMIGFQRRFDPDFVALKAALQDGRIGKTEQIAITSRDPGPPPVDYIKRSGGIFRDMMIHDFDMARFLLDAPIRRLIATGSVMVSDEIGAAGDVDTATVLMEAEGGAQIVISISRRATYGYDQRIEVLGSEGMLQAGNHTETTVLRAGADGFSGAPLQNFFMDRYARAYADEMRAFMACVADGTPPPVTGADGLAALELADAAAQSATSGAWVTL